MSCWYVAGTFFTPASDAVCVAGEVLEHGMDARIHESWLGRENFRQWIEEASMEALWSNCYNLKSW